MASNNRKSFLELKSIWKDDDMFELKVVVSNNLFTGQTEVYDQFECISDFANELVGYPKGDKILFYEAGEKDSYAYFSMKYYPIDNSGHIGVEINIESNVSTIYRPEEKNKLKVEIIVEPSAIDNFQNELFNLAKNEDGTAILFGNDNRLDN
ncbi:hypothetical protein [Chryseobacterium sp. W4I1]|uniref:hypothetical protein n=1 Tax=Chryseobacterium sp. W4I1 TaxID=3042293 RepID=UPI002788CFEF|nr:hypothetical protein [Chryseobacterium sp. W4I1]MDQ0781089.1 hypothetical protein [Chryseobacterium sp. W4I1]